MTYEAIIGNNLINELYINQFNMGTYVLSVLVVVYLAMSHII